MSGEMINLSEYDKVSKIASFTLYNLSFTKNAVYNYIVMQPHEIAALVVSILTILTAVLGGVKWLVKHYFQEIKNELKPNHGSSIKDQVTRLEIQHSELDKKIDRLTEFLINHIDKNSR
jgi:hypothetical protein